MYDSFNDSFFVRILVSLWSRKTLFIKIFLGSLIVATVVAWIMPKTYVTGAMFQIKTKEKTSLPSQLTKGLKMLDPLGGSENSGASTVMAIFQSRKLAVDMIEKFRLMDKYQTKWLHLAIKKFQKSLTVSIFSEGIIQLDFEYQSQDSVKIIADSIIAYVDAKNRELATSKARVEYGFLKSQADQIDSDLNGIADSIIFLLKRFNMADFKSQMGMGLEQLAKLDQELTNLSSEAKLMETDNSGTPIKIKQLKNVIDYLHGKQRQILEGKSVSVGRTKFNFTAPYDTIPYLTKQFKFLESEIKKNEGYLLMLLPKLQETKISMVENTPTLTFIDPTYRPDYKAKPKRIVIIALIVLPVMFFSSILIVLIDILRNPEFASDPGRQLMRYVQSKSN